MLLTVENLKVKVDDKPVLNGLSLSIGTGEIHVIMGPNGSGKTSLALSLMGHPGFSITSGSVKFNGNDLLSLSTQERAKAGLFLSFQNPCEIEGVLLRDLMRQSHEALYSETDKHLNLHDFRKLLKLKAEELGLPETFITRHVNFGLSGGEKKRAEMLQLAVLQPKLSILDEIDSGLDVDALSMVCKSIKSMQTNTPTMSFLIITHYRRLLDHLKPDVVHVLQNGKITQSGDALLAKKIDIEGFTQNS